jgi:hypothetical protein
MLATVFVFFLFSNFFTRPKLKENSEYIIPPIEIKYLMAGFSSQASDSFWIRALQDFDYCDQPKSAQVCKSKSWLFSIINMTVELDKNFKEAYYYGGLSLTVLVNDSAGASIIFDKGVAAFGKDWHLLYAAGYHALYEEKNKLKASELYLKAVDNGAPDWVRLMAGRLATEGGDIIKANEVLAQLVSLESNPEWVEKLKKRIKQSESKQK